MRILKQLKQKFLLWKIKFNSLFCKFNPKMLRNKDMKIIDPLSDLFMGESSKYFGWVCYFPRFLNTYPKDISKIDNTIIQSTLYIASKANPRNVRANITCTTLREFLKAINIMYKLKDEKESSIRLGLQK